MKTMERLPSKGINTDMGIRNIDYIITNGACFFSEKRHESLLRCQDCGLKYDRHRLSLVSGKLLCKFCVGGRP